jgi:hypothetical protein
MGVLKSPKLGLSQLWNPITLRADLGSRCNLMQSCNPHQELSNSMLHAVCRQINWVDSRLFLIESQIGNLTPDPSFGHNLCFKCPNEQCEPILNIYVLKYFQWYKKRHKTLSFGPWNCSLKFGSSQGLHLPKWELPWECEGSFAHTFLHSREYVMWLPGFLLAHTLATLLPWSWVQS